MAHRHKHRHKPRHHTHAMKPEQLSLGESRPSPLAISATASSHPLPTELSAEHQDLVLSPVTHVREVPSDAAKG